MHTRLSPDRVRALTAHCRPAPKAPSKAGRRAHVLTPEAIAKAERMIYTEGRSYKEAALAVGCSLSRMYGVLASTRRERVANGGVQ